MALSKTMLEQQAQFPNTSSSEWCRLPPVGVAIEGHYRNSLFALIKSGAIKTASIKTPGARRTGMRLIYLPSLREFNLAHMDATPTAINKED